MMNWVFFVLNILGLTVSINNGKVLGEMCWSIFNYGRIK
jgi:hypothetical protein